MRTYCIPPHKDDYGDSIQSYYQVVRKNLKFIFEELEEMREAANTAVITNEISDACYIADNVLTFISAQVDRITLGFDNQWADIHSITDIFKDAAQEGKEKTIEVSRGQKEEEVDWFSNFLDKFKDLFDLAGDYFAIDRPAWDATMKRVNKKLVQNEDFSKDSVGKVAAVIDKKGNLNTSQFNPEILKYGLEMLMFYKKEVVLNAISAEIMHGFMLRGLTMIENVRNLKLTPMTLSRVLRGLLDILVAPEVGSKVKEVINESGEEIIETIKTGEVPDFSKEVEIPTSAINDIYQETIKNHNLVDRFGSFKNMYSYYEEEIKSETENHSKKYGFFAVHDIDAPNIACGFQILIEDFTKYVIPKAMNKAHKLIFGNSPELMGRAYAAGITYERAINTIEEYNADNLDFKGVKRIISDLKGIKELYDYRDDDNIPFVAIFNTSQEKIKSEMKTKVTDSLFTFYNPFGLDIENKDSARDHNDYLYCNKPEEDYYLRLYHNEGWETYDYNYQEYMQIANQDKKIQLIEQVKKVKEYFPKKDYSYMYQNDELELIIVSPNIDNSDDPHYGGYRYIGMTSDYYYKIVFKSLEEIAKLNGAKDLEVRRRRLEKGEKLTKQDWFKMSEVIKFNRESKQKNYSREILPLAYRISPEQDFVILFQDRNDNDGIDWGTIFEKEKLSDIKFIPYKPNYTIVYGSADEENPPEGKQEKLELWGGTHHCYKYRKSPKEDISIAKQLISNPDVETFINGHKIGQNLERELEWESYFDQCQDQQKYRETIELEDDMILDLKYTYDLNGGFISLFKKTRFAFLKIEYRCIEKKNKEREFKEYDTLLIKEFDVYNQDYGIAIPDEVVVKAGFHSQQEESQEPKQKQIEVEKYNQNKAENKKGKLLIDGKPVTSLGLEKNERETEDYIVCIVKSSDDYLANLAHEWLGSPLRWKELEKQPGTCFTEGEQYTLQKRTKIYVPKEKVRKYKKNCKHCRWSLVEKVVNYIYGEMMTNLKSSAAEFIKEKLAFIEQEKTWRDVLKWSDNFKEVGKGYYKWYELVKTKGDWDHKEYILENYSDWSCDLLKQEMYQYDIWSNIHYGYLGLAVGFKKWELLSGAGVAQAKQGFDNVPEGYLRRRFEKIGDADFLAALDDPKDQASIEIGFELWENHGEDLNKEHLIEAIRNSKAGELAKKSCSSG